MRQAKLSDISLRSDDIIAGLGDESLEQIAADLGMYQGPGMAPGQGPGMPPGQGPPAV